MQNSKVSAIDGINGRDRRRSEPIDSAEDVGEQVTRDSDLGHLEDDVAPVADDLRSDLDELLSQAGQ